MADGLGIGTQGHRDTCIYHTATMPTNTQRYRYKNENNSAMYDSATYTHLV